MAVFWNTAGWVVTGGRCEALKDCMATFFSESGTSAACAEQESAEQTLADVVRAGLQLTPKQLPPWLFYDEAGSLLFEEITRLPEYYLTRMERGILTASAGAMIRAAAGGMRIRLVELGAGSADKTRLLLAAALAHQGAVAYQPVDVSETALTAACERIAAELPGVETEPILADYTAGWGLAEDLNAGERQLLLWIGSSVGNFEPERAVELLARINGTMRPGDGLLLGVDLAPAAGGKSEAELVVAYDDAAGVTAAFNRNVLVRLNRELGAEFEPEGFAHRAEWNAVESRMEMHLESRAAQRVWMDALEMEVEFAAGERLHTENSYKYGLDGAAELMARAGFPVVNRWLDAEGWFAVMLGRKG